MTVYAGDNGDWWVSPNPLCGIPLGWARTVEREDELPWRSRLEYSRFISYYASCESSEPWQILHQEPPPLRVDLSRIRNVARDFNTDAELMSYGDYARSCSKLWNTSRAWDRPPNGVLVAALDGQLFEAVDNPAGRLEIGWVLESRSQEDVVHSALSEFAKRIEESLI